MTNILTLYNTFTKSLKHVELSGKLVRAASQPSTLYGSLYICGPTVYADSHIGHALTYIRTDLFRRIMKNYLNINLLTVMNITDIDDKILNEVQKTLKPGESVTSEPSAHPFRKISERYYKSFCDDMKKIRVQPPDLTYKISNHVNMITDFVRRLETAQCAYTTSCGDVYFSVKSVPNYIGRQDPRASKTDIGEKRDPRDFVLWKATKPGEPVWHYESSDGRDIPGRPGWHVQCSAIASSVFGSKLDFHFGGKDLIFPHHYNEEACCCAYHQLDTNNSLHVWVEHWLHTSHVIYKDSKMSKSIGNVMSIKNFIDRASINALRLLCILHHYRTDVVFSEDELEKVKTLDHRISAFISFMHEKMNSVVAGNSDEVVDSVSREALINDTHQEIMYGVCDDFDLHRGLVSIQELIKHVNSAGIDHLTIKDVVCIWYLLKDWCDACGLEYGPISGTCDESVLELLKSFRQQVRNWALTEIRNAPKSDTGTREGLVKLLNCCDDARRRADEAGYVLTDGKSTD